MATTLYLDPESWDLALDATRSIALASEPYASAQSVANACRLWRGEAPYNTDRGVPFDQILGQQPPQRLVASWFEDEAASVPTVVTAVAVLEFDRVTRLVSGQVQCTLTDGTVINV